MLIAIDVGNTNMVFGIYRDDVMVSSFRLKTEANRTSDEIGMAVWNHFLYAKLSPDDVEGVVVASVVPQVMHALSNAMTKYFSRVPLVVDDGIDPALPYGVPGDERLGPDRAVACLAAMEKYGTPLLVLDFGTATTVDAINAKGEYMGGCISAGLRISADALFSHAAMLPKVELARPDRVLGCTAVGQMQAGTVLAYVGAMEYLIRGAMHELGCEDIQVVATGGMARLVADSTPLIHHVDPALILDGLLLIYRRHRAALAAQNSNA